MLPDFRVRQRDYLLEISRALTQELDLDKLLGRILDISVEMLAGHAGLIALQTETGRWRLRVSQGLPSPFLRFLGPLFADIKRADLDAEDFGLSEVNRVLTELIHSASMGMLNGVGLPLVARNTVVGVIYIFRNYPSVFSVDDRNLLSSFASQAAIAVQNAQLYTQISREKQRISALLDSAADGILILSPDNRIEHANPAFARMVQQKVKDIQGAMHSDVIRWNTKPSGMTLEQAVAGGWPLTSYAHLYIEGDLRRDADTTPLPVGITYAPLLSPEGTLVNTIATVRDITRFRQADELKSTFISIISHELKTPVALIKGYVSTLRREDASWDRSVVADSLEVIEEEADRLASLIENLLDASRLQAGGMKLTLGDVYLPDLAKRVAKRLQSQTSRHKIEVEFPPDFPVVQANDNRLEQVLFNLVSNAIKYAPEGSICIRGRLKADDVVVCVSDEGPGIDVQDVPFVFDRFYRAPEMVRNTKGAGLGLYLSRAIVEAHGGRIWINPDYEKGAQICFSLPRKMDRG